MKKYWIVFKAYLQRAFSSRLKLATWGFISSFVPLIMLLMYSKYYSDGRKILGYELSELFVYYISVIFISTWISHAATDAGVDIKEGNLSNFIIKPIDYIFYQLPHEVSNNLISSILSCVPIIGLILFGFPSIGERVSGLLLSNFVLFIPSVIMGFLISYFISITVGFAAFFVTEGTGFENFQEVVFELFTGKLLPLTFFPAVIFNVIKYLPFSYIVYFPTQIITAKITGYDLLVGYGIQVFWVLASYYISRRVWNLGIKKFSAVGL